MTTAFEIDCRGGFVQRADSTLPSSVESSDNANIRLGVFTTHDQDPMESESEPHSCSTSFTEGQPHLSCGPEDVAMLAAVFNSSEAAPPAGMMSKASAANSGKASLVSKLLQRRLRPLPPLCKPTSEKRKATPADSVAVAKEVLLGTNDYGAKREEAQPSFFHSERAPIVNKESKDNHSSCSTRAGISKHPSSAVEISLDVVQPQAVAYLAVPEPTLVSHRPDEGLSSLVNKVGEKEMPHDQSNS